MAIRVEHSTYHINPSSELRTHLENLGAIAFLANELGETSIFNQAKDTYHELGNAWYEKAQAEAKEKSHKNWLGGGQTYIVSNPVKWASDSSEGIFKRLSLQQKRRALQYMLKNLSAKTSQLPITPESYYNPIRLLSFNLILDAHRYATQL